MKQLNKTEDGFDPNMKNGTEDRDIGLTDLLSCLVNTPFIINDKTYIILI